MLSRVTKHTRRRSAQESSTDSREPPAAIVDKPPDLIRWHDFSDPFPPVARGGYARFYADVAPKDKMTEVFPNYCPLLSHYSNSKTTRDAPRTAPLFFSSRPPPRTLGTIRESSMEYLAPQRPTNLKIATGSPTSLRRRERQQLLRTPSIERDFAAYRRHLLSSAASIPASEAPFPETDGSAHSHSSSVESGSDSPHSVLSHTMSSAHTEPPITPPTSADSDDEFGDSVYIRALYKDGCIDELGLRSNSRTSFSTAKSGFSDD